MRRILELIVVAALSSVSLALAAAPSIGAPQRPPPPAHITAEPPAVKLWGELEAGDLSGTLRLRANTAVSANAYYFLVQGDLTGVNGTEDSIGREHITLPTPVDLPAKAARDFTLTVSGLSHAGSYAGTISVVQKAVPTKPLTIELEVTAMRRPAPRVVGGTPVKLAELKPLRAAWRDDPLQALLGYVDKVEVGLDNPTPATLPITNGEVALRRNDGRPAQGLTLQAPGGRPITAWDAAKDRVVVIKLDSSNEHPGHYVGELLLTVTRSDTRFAIPVELDIKISPVLPLLILMLSIAAGYGARVLIRTKVPRLRQLADLDELHARVDRLAQDLTNLGNDERGRLAQVSEQLIVVLSRAGRLASAGSVEEAQAAAAKVATMLDLRTRIQEVREQILPRSELRPPQASQATELLDRAEEQWAKFKDDDANATLDILAARLWAWKHLRGEAVTAPIAEPEVSVRSFQAFDWTGRLGLLPPLTRFLVLRVTRPVLYTVLVIGLGIVGLKLFYLNNATFGATLPDWLPLIGWGLATDPLSTALSNLQGKVNSAPARVAIL